VQYSRELETVYPVDPSFDDRETLIAKFKTVNKHLEDKYDWYKFRGKTVLSDGVRSNARYDTSEGILTKNYLLFRVRRTFSGKDGHTSDVTVKFSSPFKSTCEASKLIVTKKYEDIAEEKIEQDVSYSVDTLPYLGEVEPYALYFGHSIKVPGLPENAEYPTIGAVADIFDDIHKSLGIPKSTPLVKVGEKFEWFQKFSIKIGDYETVAALMASFNTKEDALAGTNPIKTEMEFKFVDGEYKLVDLDKALIVLQEVYELMQLNFYYFL